MYDVRRPRSADKVGLQIWPRSQDAMKSSSDAAIEYDETEPVIGAADYEAIFRSLPAAVVRVDSAGTVTAFNPAALDLFGEALARPGARCCDLVGCGRGDLDRPLSHHCLTAATLERSAAIHDLAVVLRDGRRVAVGVAPLDDGLGAVVVAHATGRSADPVPSPPVLRIQTFAGLKLDRPDRTLNGDWLHHRPGQLLRYLICARGHRVPSEELVDALWPGSRRSGLTSLRQAVHILRDRLEPDRRKHTQSRYVIASKGGYALQMSAIVVDADEFELEANAALLTLERDGADPAELQLARAVRLYGGDFLADEPFADWPLAERNRLHDLASLVLRSLGGVQLESDRLLPALTSFKRLTELEPLDPNAQEQLLSVMLRLDRPGEAARHYDAFRRRFARAFEYEPPFTLGALHAASGRRTNDQSASPPSRRSMRTSPR